MNNDFLFVTSNYCAIHWVDSPLKDGCDLLANSFAWIVLEYPISAGISYHHRPINNDNDNDYVDDDNAADLAYDTSLNEYAYESMMYVGQHLAILR